VPKNTKGKPVKKTDKELWGIIEKRIADGDYIILPHAKKRQIDRSITDIDVLDILENKKDRKRKRNKKKDIYTEGYLDWNYCIEGQDLDDENKIRIIVSFDESNLLVITVIRLNDQE
jgi:hypothetical protein